MFTLERDEAEISALMKLEADFWGRVQRQEPPDITGAEADSEAVSALYSDSEAGETVELFGMEDLFKRLEVANETLTVAQQTKDEILNTIKERMKTAEKGVCGAYTVSWKTQERRTLDVGALREAYPEIPFNDYMKVSKSRPFKVKGGTV